MPKKALSGGMCPNPVSAALFPDLRNGFYGFDRNTVRRDKRSVRFAGEKDHKLPRMQIGDVEIGCVAVKGAVAAVGKILDNVKVGGIRDIDVLMTL